MHSDEEDVGTFHFPAIFRNSVKLLAHNERFAEKPNLALQVHWSFSMGEAKWIVKKDEKVNQPRIESLNCEAIRKQFHYSHTFCPLAF